MDGIHRMERRRREVFSLVEEILHTATQLNVLRNAQMRNAGLDRQRWAVLLAIARSDYCLSISDLARVLRQSRQATQRMTLALARDGWIEHRPNNDDRRLLQLFLTSHGKSAIERMRYEFNSSALVFTAHIDSRATRSAIELLRSMRTRMTEFHPVVRKVVPARRIGTLKNPGATTSAGGREHARL